LGRRFRTCIGIPGHARKHRTQEELLHGTLTQLKRQSWFMNATCVILKQQCSLPAARIAAVPMATRTTRQGFPAFGKTRNSFFRLFVHFHGQQGFYHPLR
jgi:hypothetical protein